MGTNTGDNFVGVSRDVFAFSDSVDGNANSFDEADKKCHKRCRANSNKARNGSVERGNGNFSGCASKNNKSIV